MLLDAVRFAAKPRGCDAGAAQADTDSASLVVHAEQSTQHHETLDDARWAIPALSTAVQREIQVSVCTFLPPRDVCTPAYALVLSREPQPTWACAKHSHITCYAGSSGIPPYATGVVHQPVLGHAWHLASCESGAFIGQGFITAIFGRFLVATSSPVVTGEFVGK
jgi:hypothetical protein